MNIFDEDSSFMRAVREVALKQAGGHEVKVAEPLADKEAKIRDLFYDYNNKTGLAKQLIKMNLIGLGVKADDQRFKS